MDTKGIFSVQSLHLGHVAKSFGLRESPKALRSSEDVIGKIFNGAYSVLNTRNSENNRDRFSHGGKGGGGGGGRDRDAKSGKGGKGGKSGGGTTVKRDRESRDEGSNKRQRSDDSSSSNSSNSNRGESPARSTKNPGVVVKSGKDRQKLRKMGRGSSSSGSGDRNKKGGSSNSSSSKGSRLTASGVFRKTTGYFKKKLRSQMSSEFSG